MKIVNLVGLVVFVACSSAPSGSVVEPTEFSDPVYLECSGSTVLVPTDVGQTSIAVVARGERHASTAYILGNELPASFAPPPLETANQLCLQIVGNDATVHDVAQSLLGVLRWEVQATGPHKTKRVVPGSWRTRVPGTIELKLDDGDALVINFEPAQKQIRINNQPSAN